MNNVLNHLEYLLSTHDCVIVPTLGAFLAVNSPAEYDENNGTYSFPSRNYTFNESLTISDGLLISSMSRSLSIDYDIANRLVLEEVAQIRKSLEETGEFVVGRIGRLEMTMLGRFQFVPSNIDRLSPLASWIGNLSLSDLRNSSKKGITREVSNESRWPKINRFVRTAVGAAAAILIAIVASTPISVDNTYKASTVLPVTLSHNAEEYKPLTPMSDAVELMPNSNIIETNLDQTSIDNVVSASEEKSGETFTSTRFNDTDPYVLVVASFYNQKEAETFIKTYATKAQLPLDIVSADGKYRVYVATGQTLAQASEQKNLPQISKYFKEAWPTRK